MLFFSLFILGFSCLVSQIVMTRELIVSFYGNEFFIGWFLFSWLFWVGVGSILVKFLKKRFKGLSLLLICHLLAAVLIPLTIIGIRLSKNSFTAAVGQVPDFMPALMVSFFAVAGLCLVFGAQFTASVECGYQRHDRQKASNFLGMAYFYEALGFVLGGLAFSYGLILLNEFQTCAILIFLNLAVVLTALCFEKVSDKKYFLIVTIVTICLGFICSLWAPQLNIRTAALRFPHEHLIESKNSLYGNLAVTLTGKQLNFYESGLSIGTDKDEAFNENLVQFPMLSDADPQKVLLIGSGFSGALSEILKYNPKQVFYAQLDPSLVDIARAHIPAFRQVMDGGKVILLKGDPRRCLKSLPQDIDVIIINLPNPSTGLINRYFTDDFFKEVRGHLKSNGVMATHLMFAADSISGPLGDLGACLYKTIKQSFSSVVILPEDVLFILASEQTLINDPQVLIQRLKARGIHNYFVTPKAIVYRYTTDRVGQARAVFDDNKTVGINVDMHPQGYLYNLIYWLSLFHQGLSQMLAFVVRTNYLLILFFGFCSILILPSMTRRASDKALLIGAMFLGGFSLMSAEIVVIYGFQVFYGNLYYKIAWIISAFMAGTALGAFWGNRNARSSLIQIAKFHAAIAAYFVLWLLLIGVAAYFKWLISPEAWIFLGAGIGVLIGLEFSCINILFFFGQVQEPRSQLGSVYAADLLGSCLGALGVSVFMIPAYGVYKTLLFLAVINITLAGVLGIHRKS